MKKIVLCLWLLLAGTLAGHGQTPNTKLDSLQARLATLPADTNRVRLLGKLVDETIHLDTAQSLRYSRQGLRLARQLHDPSGEVEMLNALGQVYFLLENVLAAARCFQQALQLAEQHPSVGRPKTQALLCLGWVASVQHDYAESQRYFYRAVAQMRKHPYPRQLHDLRTAQSNLGSMYVDWLSSRQPYPDSTKRLCLYYTHLALKGIQPKDSPARLANCLSVLAQAHRLFENYDSAEYYNRAALRQYTRAGSAYYVARTQGLLGDALVQQHRTQEALPLLRAALAGATRLHTPGLVIDCAMQLAAGQAAAGQGLAAYQSAKVGYTMLDSLQMAERGTELAQLRVRFDTEQERARVRDLTQRAELQALQARRQRQYLWWVGSLLLAVATGLVVSGVLARRLRRERTELAATRAEQDRLYALIAHDLRSPVAAFGGLADLLTTYVERQDTARLLGLGSRVRQAAESLRELLDNLLNWALTQRGELRPVLRPVPVATLLAEVARLYQPTAAAHGIALEVDTTSPGQVLADRQMALTILRNLVSNAVQATPAGGSITIRATDYHPLAGPHLLRLEVADTGSGMSAAELAGVMGSQGPHTAVASLGRAGLGLRLSRLFAQAQGGQLSLRSTEGHGTTATLALPLPAASHPASG